MKGKRKELVKSELHQLLCDGFGLDNIHSEYGMTELLSQAYSLGGGIFETPPWMKILIRDTEDPFHILENNKNGDINLWIWQMLIPAPLLRLRIWAAKSMKNNLRFLGDLTILISEAVILWWFNIFFLSSSVILN